MTNKKATKRALILSIISMLICVVMLAGTTFAWFTDSVTSGVNRIVAGNLDVELYHTNDNVANEKVTDQTEALFKDVTLWEPGAVAYETFKITNEGTLALKYDLSINFTNENFVKDTNYGLSSALSVGVINGAFNGDRADAIANVNGKWTSLADFVKSGRLMPENDSTTDDEAVYTVVIYWEPKDDDNNWNLNNGKVTSDDDPHLNIDLGVNLFATQDTVEKDSFDEKYDMMADPVEISNADDFKNAIKNGGGFVLTQDIALTNTLMANEDAVIDLNGNTLTAPATGNMFQSQSNAAPSITISSSKPDAEINVTGGDTAVLLGYGSTVIENVTINVTGCDNFSPNPFKVYGDLTLGKGTVVNVDFLGTALINNNGAVDVVIDGAEINIGTFKTNGGSVISLNKASTLEMKDTDIKIDNYVPASGERLISIADGVTIENCNFDVKGAGSVEYDVVVKSGGAIGDYYGFVQK